MTDKIFKALGATDEHDALRIIAEGNQFMADVKAATGEETFVSAVSVIKAGVSLSRDLVAVTGKNSAAEQLGVVLAFKSSHEELPKANDKIKALEEDGRKRDVNALIKMALATEAPSELNPHAGKLTTATAKFWETRDAKELEAFLAVAPRVLPTQAKQATGNDGTPSTRNAAGRVVDSQGRTYEQIPSQQRVEQKKLDPEMFNAIRDSWIEAGRPASATAN